MTYHNARSTLTAEHVGQLITLAMPARAAHGPSIMVTGVLEGLSITGHTSTCLDGTITVESVDMSARFTLDGVEHDINVPPNMLLELEEDDQ